MATEKSAGVVKPRKEPARPQTAPRGESAFGRVKKYLSEVRTELKKTNWPTRQELIAQTQVVLGLLFIVGVFIWLWDLLLGQIFRGIMALLGVPTG